MSGISLLDDLDHYCKERLHLKHYIRYMDDIFILHESESYLIRCLSEIETELGKIGFEINKYKARKKEIAPNGKPCKRGKNHKGKG